MFTMTVLSHQTGSITLAVAGNVSSDALPEIGRLIGDGNNARSRVVLDLSEVTLLDEAAARFFSDQMQRGVELVNCPLYIRHWIAPNPT